MPETYTNNVQIYSKEEHEKIHLQDQYSIFYVVLVRQILNEWGFEGEAAVREGTRRFGTDRGLARRNRNLSLGVKINMKTLFSVCSDLPTDPRFRRYRRKLTEQERVSRTLVCPMAEMWDIYNAREIGRIYCEEFHPACYMAYAYGYTRVNLSRTLTQDGDSYCSFNVVLRPEDVPDELKKVCFSEYDPEFKEPEGIDRSPISACVGFHSLCFRVYYFMLEVMQERFGAKGRDTIFNALQAYAKESILNLTEYSNNLNCEINLKLAEKNLPFFTDMDCGELYQKYCDYDAVNMLHKYYYDEVNHFISKKGNELE